jgi:hypothetical protein
MMRKRFKTFSLFILSLLVIFSSVPGSLAEEASSPASPNLLPKTGPEKKLGGQYTYYGDLVGRINPRGLCFFGGINYRKVYGYDEKYEIESAYWQTGLGLGISPAALQAGLHFEWMPWLFLPLRLRYDYFQYTGGSGALLSFDSPNSPYGDEVRDNRHDEEWGSAHRLLFQPTLQGKIGLFIIRNQTDFAFFRFSGKGPFFLEIGEDILLKDNDFLLANRTQLLYSFFSDKQSKKLLGGPYYQITRASEAKITQQKLGLALYWEPAVSVRYLGRPHLGMMTAYHLEDPSRQGQWYLLVAAGFEYTFPSQSR